MSKALNKRLLIIGLVVVLGCSGINTIVDIKTKDITLAISSTAEPLNKLEGIVLYVQSNGTIFLGNEPISINDLIEELNAKYDKIQYLYEATKKKLMGKWPYCKFINRLKLVPVCLVVDNNSNAQDFLNIVDNLVQGYFTNIHLILRKDGQIGYLTICIQQSEPSEHAIPQIDLAENIVFWQNELREVSTPESLFSIKILDDARYQLSKRTLYYAGPRFRFEIENPDKEKTLSGVETCPFEWYNPGKISYSYDELLEVLEKELSNKPFFVIFYAGKQVTYQQVITSLTIVDKLSIPKYHLSLRKYDTFDNPQKEPEPSSPPK